MGPAHRKDAANAIRLQARVTKKSIRRPPVGWFGAGPQKCYSIPIYQKGAFILVRHHTQCPDGTCGPKSRFLTSLYRVSTEIEAQAKIKALKKEYWDANHNCTAYIVGIKPRAGALQ